MLRRFVQFSNTVEPSVVTLSGNVTLVNPVQPLNAEVLIVVKVFGKSRFVNLVQPLNALMPIVRKPLLNPTFSRFVQPRNAWLPITSTLSGNVTPVILVLF